MDRGGSRPFVITLCDPSHKQISRVMATSGNLLADVEDDDYANIHKNLRADCTEINMG